MVVKAGASGFTTGTSPTFADLTLDDADTPTLTVTDTTNTVTGVLRADDDTVDVGSTTAHVVNFLHTDNNIFHLSSTNFYSNNAAGPSLQNETASSTNPTLIPNRVDLTTGIGWSSGAIEFAVSGANVGRFNSTGLIGLPLLTVDNITMNGDAITFQDGETILRGNADQMFFKMNGSTSGGKWQFNLGATNYNALIIAQTGDGVGATVFNEDSIVRDFRIETADNAYMLYLDGAKNAIVTGADSDLSDKDNPFIVATKALTATADTSFSRFKITGAGGAVTIPSGTAPIVSSCWIQEPNITATGTATASASLYIQSAASEATTDYALWVDAGNSRFDGDIKFDTASHTQISFKGGQTMGDNAGATSQFHSKLNNSTSGGGWQWNLGATNWSALRMYQTGDGVGETIFNEDGIDRDFRVESDDDSHAFFVDAGNNAVVINENGGTDTIFRIETDNSTDFFRVNPASGYAGKGGVVIGGNISASTETPIALALRANTASSAGDLFHVYISSSALTTYSSGTHTNVASLRINEPNITIGTAEVTNASTLYIPSAPHEATNNYALFVDAGESRFDGAIFIAELSTPTAQTNFGAIYPKNDNKLYFQDGAGTEHELAFA
jgi:hypothetical protein